MKKSEASTASTASKPKIKMLSKTELKSSIPKPLPCLRSNDSVRAKSASSCKSQPVRASTKIPVTLSQKAGRGKTSASLKHADKQLPLWNSKPGPIPETHFRVCNASSPPIKRPASSMKGPYVSVQAKVNSLPHDRKMKRERSPTSVSLTAPKKINNEGNTMLTTSLDISRDESKIVPNGEILEKTRQLLTIYNELKNSLPAKELQPLELEIFRQMPVKSPNLAKGLVREKSFFRPEGSPEYLEGFEKQMGDVTRLWLQLISDLITMKLTTSYCSLARMNVPDPSLNAYEEVVKFFRSIPGEGELFQKKIEAIEREQKKVMILVMHNGLSLAQECEALRDANSRLEKTQDKLCEELNNKVAFLSQQNQEITIKHDRVVDMYNAERAKVEQQDKCELTIKKDLNETKKITKCLEGKFLEWEAKMKKMEAACKSLEVAIRNRSIACDKESKQHREISKKFNEAKQTITDLQNKLSDSNQSLLALEIDSEKLKDELRSAKASCDDLKIQRNELMEELSAKNKKLLDADNELAMFQAYIPETYPELKNNQDITSKIVLEDVNKDLQQRNLQIQKLKKELNRMEHELKEKSTTEEILLNQVADLQSKTREHEVVLKSQVEQLRSSLEDMTGENVELEKMVAQKTLELDQRDQLMRQHKRALQLRDELLPTLKNKQVSEKECIERLHAVIYEHQTINFNKGDDIFSSNVPSYMASMSTTDRSFPDPFNVDRELAFRQEKMSELYSLLELKQMELMRMERRVRELEGSQRMRVFSDRDKENGQHKPAKSRGFSSMLSSEDEPGSLTMNNQRISKEKH